MRPNLGSERPLQHMMDSYVAGFSVEVFEMAVTSLTLNDTIQASQVRYRYLSHSPGLECSSGDILQHLGQQSFSRHNSSTSKDTISTRRCDISL